MSIEIQRCLKWGPHKGKAASLAAAIEKELGEQVNLVDGHRGQFDIMVNGKVVAKRTGNLFTKIVLKMGWPTEEDVIAKVKAAL